MDMDNFRRPNRAAADFQRRPVQYDRMQQFDPAQPMQAAVPEPAPQQPLVPLQFAAATPHQAAAPTPNVSVELSLHWPTFKRIRALYHRVFTQHRRRAIRRFFRSTYTRVVLITVALVIVAGAIYPALQNALTHHSYQLGTAESLLQKKDSFLGKKLVYTQKDGSYSYNQDYSPANQTDTVSDGGPVIKASANADDTKGLTVTDPNNQIDFKISPKFQTLAAKQDANRLIYPLMDGTGWMVYTMQAGGVKEDILLNHANGDTMKLQYTMDLDSQGMAARLLPDGSVGIYGTSQPIMGNVTTSSDHDAALLKAARAHAVKDKLLFSLPTPVVYQTGGTVSKAAKTHYVLKGNTITTVTTGLKHATFPLTVDPAVTVTSTADLFRDTTPESNIDLNATNGNIARGAVTGGVLPSWTTNSNNLTTARFAQGVAIYDDYIYVAGGLGTGGSGTPMTSVEFAHVSSANPSIGTWSSTTSLPVGLARFQLLAYNGYLYAIGGTSADSLCNTTLSSVYYIRIQSNGQLAGSWTTNTNSLPIAICSEAATVYQGVIYIAGGQTAKQFNNSVSNTYYAKINPDGSVATFTGSLALPGTVTGEDLRAYNGYLYLLGGATGGGGGGTTNAVYYAPIASDGSIYGSSWTATTSFATARSNLGAAFTFAYDGFMYLVGGCNTFNASFNCSVPQQDVQIAQINADGTLGTWSTDSAAQLSTTLVGESIVSSRGNVYSIVGCSTTANNFTCTTAVATQQYSAISPPGQVGPLATQTAMPATLVGHGATVLNGYIYIAGGCAVNSCSGAGGTTGNVSYAKINADGSIGSWTTDSTNKLGTANGLAFFGFTSYNGYLYATGGFAATGASTSLNSALIYRVNPSASTGALPGAWSTNNVLSVGRYGTSAVTFRKSLYVFGGCTGNTATSSPACTGFSSVVERFPLSLTTGGAGAGTVLTALPTATAFMGTAFYNGYVYLAGGQTGTSTYSSSIYYVGLSTDQSTGGLNSSWNTATGTLAHAMGLVDAYANNGYLYVTGGYDGTTIYGTVESAKITLSSGNIGSNLANASTTMTARWGQRTVFANGFLYFLGGCTAGTPMVSCSARSALDESVEQYYASNKNTSAWTNGNTTNLVSRVNAATTVYGGYIYVAGGCITSYSAAAFTGGCTGNETAGVRYAQLNPDGTIGTWNTATNALPQARSGGCIVASAGYLYFLGGLDTTDTATATVYYGQIGSGGAPGTWGTTTQGLANDGVNGVANRAFFGCALYNGYIYIAGGLNNSGTVFTTVWHSPSISSGGDITALWTQMTSFTGVRENNVTFAAGGYLYVMGGDDGNLSTGALYDVQYIQLDPSTGNNVGSWAYSADLPVAISGSSAFEANGYVYVIGGRTAASTCVNTTQVASINSTGMLSPWNLSVNNLASGRFGTATAFYNGYYYTMGGYDCTAAAIVSGASIVSQGGMRSQAMKGSFSKYADLNGDGRPEKLVIYLTNAQNNGVDIDTWTMTYKSSREAANSWGVTTLVSPLVNQNAYQVYAYDGSAVDQIIARYYQLTFNINMEQSFTFTDDTQPTVFQYGLHYAPPPSKRLLHGRDFRDQNQQGEDLKLGI